MILLLVLILISQLHPVRQPLNQVLSPKISAMAFYKNIDLVSALFEMNPDIRFTGVTKWSKASPNKIPS